MTVLLFVEMRNRRFLSIRSRVLGVGREFLVWFTPLAGCEIAAD